MKKRLVLSSLAIVLGLFFAASPEELATQAQEKPKLQSRNELANWRPDTPFDLSGDMPDGPEMRKAVVRAMNFILQGQREDGSWDVELSGQILSNTADDAVDAVCATSMSCMALRDFAYLNPQLAEPAIKNGAEFVMSRVLRGKLQTNVWYAIWRYSFGLRFLMGEYRNSTDAAYRTKLFGVCRRMVDAIMSMQKTNEELEAYLKLQRFNKTETPTRTGVIFLPSRGDKVSDGAQVSRVEVGSAAEAAGIKRGDRIIALDKAPISNVYDFHIAEAEMIEGDEFKVTLERKGEDSPRVLKLELIERWPADIGFTMIEGSQGVEVERFWPGSAAKIEGMEKGDIILRINRSDIKTRADAEAALAEVEIGKRVSIRYQRDKKKSTARFESGQRRPAWMGVTIDKEDKGQEDGVVISALRGNSSASRAGLKKGDRITYLNGHPVTGPEHYQALMDSLWEGQEVKLSGFRLIYPEVEKKDGEEEDKSKEGEEKKEPEPEVEFFNKTVRLSAFLSRGEMQFSVDANRGGIFVSDVLKNGAAYGSRGLKKGDILRRVNDERIKDRRHLRNMLARVFVGEIVAFTIERNGKKRIVNIEAQTKAPTRNNEEGGWAYYHEKPHAPSFVTAAVILNFLEFDETFETVSRKHDKKRKNTIKNATDALMGLRVYDEKNRVHSYVYDIRLVKSEGGMDIHGNVGRIMVGELAANAVKRLSASKLKKSLKNFFEFRGELDMVRNYPHTHYQQRFNNAAYYWLFGHYYAAASTKVIGGTFAKKAQEDIVKAVMLKRNKDGTWYGHKGFGKLCGTAHALLVLGQLREMEWANMPKSSAADRDQK